MILGTSLLHAHLLGKTDENIRYCGQGFVKGVMWGITILPFRRNDLLAMLSGFGTFSSRPMSQPSMKPPNRPALMRLASLAVLISSTWLSGQVRTANTPDFEPVDSGPRIDTLKQRLLSGDRNSLNEFWRDYGS